MVNFYTLTAVYPVSSAWCPGSHGFVVLMSTNGDASIASFEIVMIRCMPRQGRFSDC